MTTEKLSIHVLGLRGLPSTYSGYETIIGELAPRFVERGHDVTVYCRRSLFEERPASWRGVHLRYLPSLEHKAFSTLSHSFLATLAAVSARPSVILTVNAANGWYSWIPWVGRVPHVINVNGMEWLRPKWKGMGRSVFLNGARMACRFSDVVVTDAEEMHRLYAEQFGVRSIDIAYGANIEDSTEPERLSQFGLEPGRYFLIASRMVPDNNADLILSAFVQCQGDFQFAVAGGADYRGNARERAFIDRLRAIADDRVRFLGHVGSETVRELHCNCFAYVHGHQFGGINPSLLKALGYGNMILALDTPFNSEVLDGGRYGILYEKSVGDLSAHMQRIMDDPDQAQAFRDRARDRIRERFTWETITDQYEAMFRAVHRRADYDEIAQQVAAAALVNDKENA